MPAIDRFPRLYYHVHPDWLEALALEASRQGLTQSEVARNALAASLRARGHKLGRTKVRRPGRVWPQHRKPEPERAAVYVFAGGAVLDQEGNEVALIDSLGRITCLNAQHPAGPLIDDLRWQIDQQPGSPLWLGRHWRVAGKHCSLDLEP